jgi:fructose-specific phosphotransferase system IIA component
VRFEGGFPFPGLYCLMQVLYAYMMTVRLKGRPWQHRPSAVHACKDSICHRFFLPVRPLEPPRFQGFPMRLTDIVQSGCVKVPLASTTKQDAINELVEILAAEKGLEKVDSLKEAVWQREMTRTTGIGHGVGIPHGKCACVDTLCMAIGKADPPIEFGSIDGKPVDLIFLLASPQDQTGPHIQALATISRMLTDIDFRDAIKECTDSASLYKLICDHEAKEVVG